MAPLRLLGAVAFLFLQVAQCDNFLVSRDHPLVPGEVKPIADIEYKPKEGSMPLSGRELVSEWMNKGGISKRTCVDPGYQPCSSTGCCPSAQQCCPGSVYCKTDANGVCCGSIGTCPGGYTCNSVCRCVESGGTCCSNGRYCQKGNTCCALGGCAPLGGQCCSNGQICDTGNICVVNRLTGRYGCCTDLSCTAYVSSGNTVPLTHSTPQTTAAPHTTAAPPVVTTPTQNEVYIYYYWTISWSYYSYYYTYVYAAAKTTLTTTYVTTTTTISAYETDSVDASSELSRLSSSYFSTGFPTPTDATTALAAATTVGDTPTETG
ncbi:hypothetical protein O988_02880, partial [Pseudogymnoascus sp. VKM F-3808]